MGYLIGVRRLAFNTDNIGGRKNTKIHTVWRINCGAGQPDDRFDSALNHLVVEIEPNRATQAPCLEIIT